MWICVYVWGIIVCIVLNILKWKVRKKVKEEGFRFNFILDLGISMCGEKMSTKKTAKTIL